MAVLFYGMRSTNDMLPRRDIRLSDYKGLFVVEEDSWGTVRFNRGFYSFYAQPKGHNFLIVHEFTIASGEGGRPILRDRSSGYGFPVLSSLFGLEIYRFMIDHENPMHRIIQVLRERDRQGRSVCYQRAHHNVDLNSRPTGEYSSDAFDLKLVAYTPEDNRLIKNLIELRLWDIIL